jgi:pyrophosphate--fructose-6-phosphate 1-phosphotransferase
LSHVAAECALQTHPNLVLISEEISAKRMCLPDVVNFVSDIVCDRAADGHDYGVILLPESLLETVPEMLRLNAEITVLQAAEPFIIAHDVRRVV